MTCLLFAAKLLRASGWWLSRAMRNTPLPPQTCILCSAAAANSASTIESGTESGRESCKWWTGNKSFTSVASARLCTEDGSSSLRLTRSRLMVASHPKWKWNSFDNDLIGAYNCWAFEVFNLFKTLSRMCKLHLPEKRSNRCNAI